MTPPSCITARAYQMLLCVWLSLIFSGLTNAQMRHVKYYNINENIAVGTQIGDLVTDVNLHLEYDPTELDELQFQVLASGSRVNITLLEGTGKLVVVGDVDREVLCPTLQECEVDIDIYVSSDNGGRFNIIKVTFSINDVNDNAPRFAQPVFTRTLLETTATGTLFPLPYAEDRDSDRYGIKQYQLVPASPFFSLQMKSNPDGSKDVLMRLDKQLDYERQKHINFTLNAYDGGRPQPLYGSMQIVIAVSDANDHIPAFANSTYQVSIAENIVSGSTILRVQAIDADSGFNSMISYAFSARTQDLYGRYFRIDSELGDIIVQGEIDYETHASFHLSVTGHDNGPNSHSVDTTVIVSVTDENDCKPQIDINTLGGQIGVSEIYEESPTGTFVALLSVSDRDSGVFGAVSCQLVSNYFSLNNISDHEYQILTKQVFDREKRHLYEIVIRCEDGGPDPNLSEQRIEVQVLDINDHSPIFTRPFYEAELPENMYQDHTVLQIEAIDEDFGENSLIHYSLDSSVAEYFRIEPLSGLIKTIQQFDREQQNQYVFGATAMDGGNRSATVEIIINIIDINDEEPVFILPRYVFNVTESEAVNLDVGAVKAKDIDGDPYNRISYSIIQEPWFSIDAVSGLIRNVKPLDRERRERYRFTVQATDNKHITSVYVSIIILDKNDNAPIFRNPPFRNESKQITNELAAGIPIYTVSAFDPDAGQNGSVTYSIASGDNNKFEIDNVSGIIRTKRDLKLNDRDTFLLRIFANDSGTPQLYNDTTLNLVVNKSLAAELNSVPDETIIIGTNFSLVIIVSSALACVILILIMSIMCIYCRKKPHERKHECEYDQCQMRDDTMETLQDGGQFDSLPRPQIGVGVVKEYIGPTIHGFSVDSPFTMDDSGLQIDDMMYHQKPVNNKQALEGQEGVYSSNYISRGTPTRMRDASADAKKLDVKSYKREVDQDSTYSGDGSNPDSGKGPSEEGDNSAAILHPQVMPPLLPPVLEEEPRPCDVTSSCQNGGKPCCAASDRRSNQYGYVQGTSQPYITGIAMCKCKSCHTHHNRVPTGGHYGTVVRQKDNNIGAYGYDARTNSLTRASHSIDKVPKIPPRVPVRAETTRASGGGMGVSAFGSCRDVEIPQKTVTFKNDHEPQTHYYQNQNSFNDNSGGYKNQIQNNHYQVPRSINHNNVNTAKAPPQHNQIAKSQSLHNQVTNQLTFNNNKTGSQPHQRCSDMKASCDTTPRYRGSYDGEEVDLNSSTTSGSYVVDHLDMSDVLNDSHWNIRDSVV